jgi:hypothetical protein
MARKGPKRRGFGRIRQERSGRFSGAYVGPDTKLHRAPRTYATESDAEGWLAIERRKIDLGTWGLSSAQTASHCAPMQVSGSSNGHCAHARASTMSPGWSG